jgi:hypothetical protein
MVVPPYTRSPGMALRNTGPLTLVNFLVTARNRAASAQAGDDVFGVVDGEHEPRGLLPAVGPHSGILLAIE